MKHLLLKAILKFCTNKKLFKGNNYEVLTKFFINVKKQERKLELEFLVFLQVPAGVLGLGFPLFLQNKFNHKQVNLMHGSRNQRQRPGRHVPLATGGGSLSTTRRWVTFNYTGVGHYQLHGGGSLSTTRGWVTINYTGVGHYQLHGGGSLSTTRGWVTINYTGVGHYQLHGGGSLSTTRGWVTINYTGVGHY